MLQLEFNGTGLLNVSLSLFVSYTIPAILELTLLSTVTAAFVMAAGDDTFTVASPLSIFPPDESITRILIPETNVVESGFLKFVTLNATSVPPAILVPTPWDTVRTELANEH
jgi:hypothetical protein